MPFASFIPLATLNKKFVPFFLPFHFLLDTSRTPSQLERDAGFCSGGSEIGDDYQSDRIQSSPSSTVVSEDSVDIKLGRIVIPEKRKSFDTIKCENDVPLKKRFKYESIFGYATSQKSEEETLLITEKSNQSDAFRPWIPEQHPTSTSPPPPPQQQQPQQLTSNKHVPNEAELLARHPGVTTLHRVPSENANSSKLSATLHQDEEPLALVINNKLNRSDNKSSTTTTTTETSDSIVSGGKKKASTKNAMKPKLTSNIMDDEQSIKSNIHHHQQRSASSASSQRNCKNYKNMTRERRIEANARERTRVHTISAAFDTLRSAIPSYSNTQKLSKLSILRVACSYILTLSRMNGMDYSADQSAPSIQSCLEEITKNIQTEGKARKRKDE